MNRSEAIKRMVVAAVFTAIAYVCVCVFRIKVSFLTFDIKDSVITVCAMIFGPLTGLGISLAVSFIEMITISDTQLYGFIMNVLSTAAFSMTASAIYRKKRDILGSVLGLVSAVCATTAVMLLANLLITPYYIGADIETVAALIPKLLLPFNFMKSVLNASLVMLIYKPIVTALRRAGAVKASAQSSSYSFDRRSLAVMFISLAVMAVSLVVFFVVMGADVEWFQAFKK
ncbi:MAG: ECF transporter S component [Clostridia bacterium]|nr:ECF transporter S component [Clostridia bacterium]